MLWFDLILAVAFNVSHNLLFKLSALLVGRPWLQWSVWAAALSLGAVNAFFFSRALHHLPLNLAFPVFSAASVTMVIVLSRFLYGEPLPAMRVVGALVAVLGITLVARE